MTRRFTRLLSAMAVAGLTLTAVAAGPAGTARAGPRAAQSNGRFYGVAALSATDAWAVGLHPGAFIAHWDGTTWAQSYTRSNGFFYGVAASAPGDVWAAGGTNWFHAKTMINHWNGTTWTRVHTPSPGTASYFRAVAATSATDAWAVGETGSSPGEGESPGTKTLIEHWNGTAWTHVPSPSPQPVSALYAVAAVSPTDAWAVGWTAHSFNKGGHLKALILHWDGTAWTKVPTPPETGVILFGMTATSATDAWAAGTRHLLGHTQTYILHWDGTSWTHVPSPSPTPGGTLQAVTALSPTDVWVTGMSQYKADCSPPCRTLTEHWNGTAWTIVPSPNPSGGAGLNGLLGVAATASNDVWAVGTIDFNATLIEHWDGTAWIQMPSPQDSQPPSAIGLISPHPQAR